MRTGNRCKLLTKRLLMLAAVVSFARGMPAARPAEADSTARKLAREILSATGVRGGLVVHLGCGDGRLTAALRADNGYTVHGLAFDAGRVEAARTYIVGKGLYGPVSVERLAGTTLPYASNLINLVVASDCGPVDMAEIRRVLAPLGVAYVRQGEAWKKFVKPRPADIDEWSHFLHDAGNNAVARDARVGPPRSLQWVAPPLWLRSHETPSGIEGLVSAGGRLFYFFDEGLIGITDPRLPARWSLVCRDAFNGKLLWKRPVRPWGWRQWAADRFAGKDWTKIRGARTVVPVENQQRLVATGNRLYATLGYRAPLSILDAATGKILTTIQETGPAREILVADGVVVVHTRDDRADAARRRGAKAGKSRMIAVDGATGKILWQEQTGAIRSLLLAVDRGHVIYQSGARLACLRLADGSRLWDVASRTPNERTLIAHDGVVLIYFQKTIEARDGGSGRLLWRRDKVPGSAGSESPDLFVARGVVWRGMIPVDERLQPVRKSENALAIGFDLRTGKEKRRVVVRRLRSPEHHHRCYRNKATEHYIISGMEGAEFMDLEGNHHGQNNWLRGACRLGIMPCNGLLYVPADQCFCQPGGKFLGFAAMATELPERKDVVADARRLERGEAFGAVAATATPATVDDWPTYRHDAARHGTTATVVPPRVAPAWYVRLGGHLTAPVVAADRIYVASRDAHAIHALNARTGTRIWRYIAGGRIDAPPTVYKGLVLFGCADGRVYCVRAADGALAWRFLAAPTDCRIGCFDQIESVWPVHGSVLIHAGIAYVAAGRSSYLDGGIRLYALDPMTGRLLHKTTYAGPFPNIATDRDKAFFVPGANAEVLVSEGNAIYMRQKKFTPELRQVKTPVLSSKGAQDVGLHVFSTASLLDGSWYNRTFWMYAKRWPGFQLANQAPKSGQLLVVDDKDTYAVKVFYRRNIHSPMFFPGRQGYLLFADKNTTEPQIVGEPGSRKPVAWLPQARIPRSGNWGLDSQAFSLDKMIGYTRAEPPRWTRWLPIRMRGMVKADAVLFVAGPPDLLDPQDPYAAFEGRKGARLAAIAAKDGAKLAECELPAPPVFDGLIAAHGRLYVSLEDGTVVCLEGSERP